jgi:hypothetical protein
MSDDRQDNQPPPDDNPYAAPREESAFPGTGSTDSPLVRKLRRSTGDDLIGCAVAATVMGHCIPFGFLLHMISLFLLARVLWVGARPATWAVILGVVTAIWNVLMIAAALLVILAATLAEY